MNPREVATSPVGVGVQAGLLALYPIGSAPRAVQIAFVAVPATAGGVFAYTRTAHRDDRGVRMVGALGAATALTVAQLSTLWLDRASERFLRRLNVPAPRVAIALGAGLGNATLSVVLKRWSGRHSATREDGGTE